MSSYFNKYTIILAFLFTVSRVNFHSLYTKVVTPVMQEIVDTDDPYATLDVDFTMSHAEIHKKWKKMVVKYHPDKNRDDPTAADKINEINAAWSQIKNPEDKEWYDSYYMLLVVVKKVKKCFRMMNMPVILVAKMMGLPEPEENYLQFDGLQYAWGFVFAMILQIIPIFMWNFAVPGFIKSLFAICWDICMTPFRICWWSTKMSWSISGPGIKAAFLLYNAWVIFPRAEYVDKEYQLRMAAFMGMHYLMFVNFQNRYFVYLKWAVIFALEAWLVVNEDNAMGGKSVYMDRGNILHLFPSNENLAAFENSGKK